MIQYSKYFTFSSTSIFQLRFFSTIPVRKQRIVWHARKRRRTPKPNIFFRWLALKSFPPRTWNKICKKRKVGHQVLAKHEIHLVADLSTLGQDVHQGKTKVGIDEGWRVFSHLENLLVERCFKKTFLDGVLLKLTIMTSPLWPVSTSLIKHSATYSGLEGQYENTWSIK